MRALRSSELSDATVTVTNLGEQGVETVYGVIYPPQVALVGFGKVVERPWVGERRALRAARDPCARSAADHRASVGHRGALFLVRARSHAAGTGKLLNDSRRHSTGIARHVASVAPEADSTGSTGAGRCASSSTSTPSTF